MSSINSYGSMISSLMVSDNLAQRLNRLQQDLFDTQTQISTGKKVQQPSDDPASVSAILYLNQQLAWEDQYQQNVDQATGVLNVADQALADTTNVLRSAQSLASSQIGVGSDTSTRASQVAVVDSQLQAVIAAANRQYNGIPIFGGNGGAGANGQVFSDFLGGVRYTGSTDNMTVQVGTDKTMPMNSNGQQAFGALSARVKSPVDLAPKATSGTLLSNLGGATNERITKGSVLLTVDGTTVSVDLAQADSMGDVTKLVNQAINGIDPTAGALSLGNSGFVLGSNAGHTIAIANNQNGATADDLGIAISATGGASTSGADVNVQLTRTTRLADLGATVDWLSGMSITQGSQTKTLNFSGATTIEDLMNRFSQLNLGLKLEINSSKTGLNLVDTVSGLNLSVGENGGTTATDLGLRTYSDNTKLSDFRHGLGVQPEQGKNDFSVTLHNGTSFKVNLDGATTVGDVVTKIQAAATGAGIGPGQFTVGMAPTGNGMRFTDGTTGGSDFKITNLNESLAATQLGIAGNAGSGSTLTGADKATVRVANMITHLMDLREALQNDSSSGITIAGSALQDDLNNVIQARATVGVESKNLSDEKTRSQDRQLQQKTMLSDLQDANMPAVITRYSQLQAQLQASLKVGADINKMNLMNYL